MRRIERKTMAVRLAVATLATVGLSLVGRPALAQVEAQGAPNPSTVGAPLFAFDTLNFLPDDTSSAGRLDTYLRIDHNRLTFIRARDSRGFEAGFEVTLAARKKGDDRLVAEKTWSERVRVASFEETNSARGYNLAQRTLRLEPGDYKITATLRDDESGTQAQQTRDVTVRDLRPEGLSAATISDLMLIQATSAGPEGRQIVPHVSSRIAAGLRHPFSLFVEAYRAGRDTVGGYNLRYKLVDLATSRREAVVWEGVQPVALTGRRTQQVLQLQAPETVGGGEYRLDMQLVDASDRVLDQSSRPLSMTWGGMPASIKNVTQAIAQVAYVAKETEMRELRAAKTDEEKRAAFDAFWKRRDPTPDTPENELMAEYFRRVDFANRSFSHYIEGWKTDMGMVFITFGPPDQVDRHPMNYDTKPYEIWDYNTRNCRFVFQDLTGFGDYRLTEPVDVSRCAPSR